MTLDPDDPTEDELYKWAISESGNNRPSVRTRAGATVRRSLPAAAVLLAGVGLLSLLAYQKREAIQQWDFNNNMAKTVRQVQIVQRSFLLECRHSGTPREGTYFKEYRGYATTELNGRLGGAFSDLLVRVPPPSGAELRMYDNAGKYNPSPDRAVFFACSARLLNGRRLFFFHCDLKTKYGWWQWLRDDEMSWYYQTPIESLTADEQAVEEQYRKYQNLHFPLGTIPDEPNRAPLEPSSFCEA